MHENVTVYKFENNDISSDMTKQIVTEIIIKKCLWWYR